MDLYVNGRFLTRRLTGVDRVAREVVQAIDRMLVAGDPLVRGLSVTVLAPPGQLIDAAFAQVKVRQVGSRQGTLWEQIDLAREVPAGGLLLSMCNTGPAFRRDQVVIIHDAGTERMPQGFSRSFRWWYRLLMPMLGRNARRIVTPSQFARNEVHQVYGVPLDKISAVGGGAEHILSHPLQPAALSRMSLGARPYLLAVSSMAAHKNFQLILDALALMEDPPFDIAIAGGANQRIFGAAGAVKSERVHWLGYVSDLELRALYSGALGFVFPSLYEGYGLPPVEAMACGCPVLAANAASIPEVCGDAALYFDPRDAASLKDTMLRLAGDGALRAQLVERGLRRVAGYTWDSVARNVLADCGVGARAGATRATVDI